ncbi:MAG: VOC family protein [bacterium]|nr:VOC family protein [bacterium]
MAKLNPFIRFNDKKCREAMTFYKDCLGGELNFMTAKDSPMEKDMSPDQLDLIMHSTLKKDGWTLMGSDMMRDKAVLGDNVGVSLECDSEEHIHAVFKKLADGGEVFMAPDDAFWGSIFSVVTDKYGVEWMLNFQKTPVKK